jgi:hypothetical protein
VIKHMSLAVSVIGLLAYTTASGAQDLPGLSVVNPPQASRSGPSAPLQSLDQLAGGSAAPTPISPMGQLPAARMPPPVVSPVTMVAPPLVQPVSGVGIDVLIDRSLTAGDYATLLSSNPLHLIEYQNEILKALQAGLVSRLAIREAQFKLGDLQDPGRGKAAKESSPPPKPAATVSLTTLLAGPEGFATFQHSELGKLSRGVGGVVPGVGTIQEISVDRVSFKGGAVYRLEGGASFQQIGLGGR